MQAAAKRSKLPLLATGAGKYPLPTMATLLIEGGRQDKLRPADVLGALTGEGGLSGEQVGKINVMERRTYVAVQRQLERRAFERLSEGRIKKRRFRVSKVAAG